MQHKAATARNKRLAAINRRFYTLAVREALATATAAEAAELDRMNRERNPVPPLETEWREEQVRLMDELFAAFSGLLTYYPKLKRPPPRAAEMFRRAVGAYGRFHDAGFDGWRDGRRRLTRKAERKNV